MAIKEEKTFMDKHYSNHKKKVLVVGANSTIGFFLINKFFNEGWQVFASASTKKRIPEKRVKGVNYLVLNLEKSKSIKKTIAQLIKVEQKIDVVINSAGLVFSGPIEGFSEVQIRRQMEVNYFGVVNIIRAILPSMRKHKLGTIVNISSLCGLLSFPMLSIYHASKWALEGFSESIYYELQPFGIKVKLIEPGGIKAHSNSSNIQFAENNIEEYESLKSKVHATTWFPSFTEPEEVAQRIYHATTDNSNQLRYLIGEESKLFLQERGDIIACEDYLTKMKNRFC